MNALLLKLGIRNVLRQRRRSLFNVLTLGVNTAMLILLIGVLRGFYLMTIERTVDLRTGHIQIHHQRYQEEKRRLPLDITVSNAEAVQEVVEDQEGIIAASPKIVASASLSNGRERAGILLYGVHPESERKVGVILDGVIDGATLTDTSWGILIGDRLAELLDAKVGSVLMIQARTKLKANNLLDAEVVGIFDSGFGMMDRTAVYAPMAFTEELLDMRDEVTEFVIRAENYRVVQPAVEEITAALKRAGLDSLIVEPWTEIARDVVAGLKADLISYSILGVIMVILAVFGVTNTMTVSVFERTAEIGGLRALGMERKQIHSLFLAEGFALGIGGLIIGCILGGILVFLMGNYGISMSLDAIESINIPLPDEFRSRTEPVDFLFGGVLAILCALAGAVLPARRAARVPVTSALAKGVR